METGMQPRTAGRTGRSRDGRIVMLLPGGPGERTRLAAPRVQRLARSPPQVGMKNDARVLADGTATRVFGAFVVCGNLR